MSYDPATTGEAPISWGEAPPPLDEQQVRSQPELIRVLGFGATDIGMASWLPDESTALTAALVDDGRPFNGAFVPLVIHDPLLSERSFDAAEWAADLIRGEGGTCLCITPFAEKERIGEAPLSARQWNHTAAMIERLDELCKRFALRPMVSDTVGEQQTREEGGLDPDLPIHFVLDTGSFLPDGFVPTKLRSPEKIELDGHPLADRLRGLLRHRR